MKDLLPYILGITLVGAITVGGWFIKRSWNYYFGYESQTIETICETVKPEYLIDPTVCDK